MAGIPGYPTGVSMEITAQSLRQAAPSGGVDSAERLRELARSSAVSRAAAAAGQAGQLGAPLIGASATGIVPPGLPKDTGLRVQSADRIRALASRPDEIMVMSEIDVEPPGFLDALAVANERAATTENDQVVALRKKLASAWEDVKLCCVIGSRRQTDKLERVLFELLSHLAGAADELDGTRAAHRLEVESLENTIQHLRRTMFEKSQDAVSKMRNMAGNSGVADVFSLWSKHSYKMKLERDSKRDAEDAKRKAKESEEKAQMKMLNSMGLADDKAKRRAVFTAWHGEYKSTKAKYQRSQGLVLTMCGANDKMLVTRCLKSWKEVVVEHQKRQAEKVNEADQEELVTVVKELEHAYHQERYQTKAQKERIKELEIDVARLNEILEKERESKEHMHRQVMESESTKEALPVLRNLDASMSRLMTMVEEANTNVGRINDTTSRTALEVFAIQQTLPTLGGGDGNKNLAARQAAWTSRDSRNPQQEMEELQLAMQKWHAFEDTKRQAVSRIKELGGSPPRCVTVSQQERLPPSGAPSSPVAGPPVFLPPPFDITGDPWSIDAKAAWEVARKQMDAERSSQSSKVAPQFVQSAPMAFDHASDTTEVQPPLYAPAPLDPMRSGISSTATTPPLPVPAPVADAGSNKRMPSPLSAPPPTDRARSHSSAPDGCLPHFFDDLRAGVFGAGRPKIAPRDLRDIHAEDPREFKSVDRHPPPV